MSTIQEHNYFELLGLPVSFEVDSGLLNDNYRKIQKSIHPDNFSNASAMERRLSVQKAAQVNDAFHTLKTPLKRAIYLLSLSGIELNENDNSLAPEFLMQQIELRESLAAVSSAVQPMDSLDAISNDVKSRISTISEQLAENFCLLFPAENILTMVSEKKAGEKKHDDNIDTDKAAGLKVKALVLKMQFLNRLQEECINMEEELAERL